MTPSDLAALLRACKDEPADDLPRRALADWLDEHGQADRAEFIRLQLRLRSDDYEESWTPESAANKARELRLLRQGAPEWLGGRYAFWRWCDVPTGADRTASVRLARGLARVQVGDNPVETLQGGWPEQVVGWLEGFESARILDDDTWRALVTGRYLEPFSDINLYWENADPAAVIDLLERARPTALRLGNEGMGNGVLRALAKLSWFRPRCLSISPSEESLAGWKSLTASEVMSEVRSFDGTLPARGVSMLASAPHLDKLNDLCLLGDGMASRTLRRLFHSERVAGLTDLVVLGYSGPGNPAVAAALASSPSLRNLKRLNLGSNPLPEAGVIALARSEVLDSVLDLSLYGCAVLPRAATALAVSPHLRSLARLDLSNNNLGDEVVIALAGSPHLGRLRHLELTQCKLTDSAVTALANSLGLAGLEALDIEGNDFTDAALAALASSRTLGNLRRLSFSHIRNLGEGFRALVGSPVVANLACLKISNVFFGPAEAEALASSPWLGNLREFTATDLDAACIRTLANAHWLDGLIELSIRSSEVGDDGVKSLTGHLHSGALARLDLAGETGIGPEGAKALLDWPGIVDLVELSMYGSRIGEELQGELERAVRHLSGGRRRR